LAHGSFISVVSFYSLDLFSLIWIAGAVGYYSSLVVWIIAQRTHHLHGRYSHSWAIGMLLIIFGSAQIIGSPNDLILGTGTISLAMPLMVTTMDFRDHRRERRGLLEHKDHCWMKTEDDIDENPLIHSHEEKQRDVL